MISLKLNWSSELRFNLRSTCSPLIQPSWLLLGMAITQQATSACAVDVATAVVRHERRQRMFDRFFVRMIDKEKLNLKCDQPHT